MDTYFQVAIPCPSLNNGPFMFSKDRKTCGPLLSFLINPTKTLASFTLQGLAELA